MDPRGLRRPAGPGHVRRQPRRLPRREHRAARRRRPARARLLGNYDPSTWEGWGGRGDSAFFNNPFDSLAHAGGGHLDWLRSRLSLLLVCVERAEDSTGALPSTQALAGLPAREGSAASWTSGATTCRTTGPPGRRSRPSSATVLLRRNPEETKHLVGLLGTEEDWPTAFETLVERLGPIEDASGATHRVETERITMEPFDLLDKPRYDLVVDRLAYWYFLPREWLKKVALMDDVYLLNSQFTFQSMEKHATTCAMLRLGLKSLLTVLVPHKNPPDNQPLRVHGGQVQPPLRPRRDRRADRLPAVR